MKPTDIYFMVEYAKQFIGIPYKWGGSNPMEGFDCSGFIQEVLASIGKDPKGDQTAQALFNHFVENRSSSIIEMGMLLFFGKSITAITHVALAINGRLMLEAGGGNEETINREKASERNAFIRVRPIQSRHDFITAAKIV